MRRKTNWWALLVLLAILAYPISVYLAYNYDVDITGIAYGDMSFVEACGVGFVNLFVPVLILGIVIAFIAGAIWSTTESYKTFRNASLNIHDKIKERGKNAKKTKEKSKQRKGMGKSNKQV